jgi:hypothetical protein
MSDKAAESAARTEFDARVHHLLQTSCEVARALVADAAAVGLDALRKVMALRLGEPAPVAPLDAAARFVVIETA